MSNYPPSINPSDPAAPWNWPDESAECSTCGEPCDAERGICEDCEYFERMDILTDLRRDEDLFN